MFKRTGKKAQKTERIKNECRLTILYFEEIFLGIEQN